MHNFYLTFSDGAKYADIARNIIRGSGYVSSFSFWGSVNNAEGILPFMPYSLVVFFRMFGISDVTVMATSVFYFVLSLVFVFLLARQIFKSNLTAFLSTIAVGFNHDLIQYAINGASESPFIFEIVATLFFISVRKKWSTFVAILILVLMYLTRPQAIIYILGSAIYYLFLNFPWKKAAKFSIGALLLSTIIYLLFSGRGSFAITQNLPGVATSDALRGGLYEISILTLFKKLFYNLYNFYKLLPQIINPYLFSLFVLGCIKWGKKVDQNIFKISTIFMTLATFLATALTIPFFRYIHPIIPLVYIVGVGTLVEVVSGFITNLRSVHSKFRIYKTYLVVVTCFALILLFCIGQTIGMLLLDSRFERSIYNVEKPPVYVQLSYILRDNTEVDKIVVTNLDTWGSWYGERKTVWFPLNPKQLINSETGEIPFDAIYLTSYLIDDENYYMGKSWRQILNNPESPEKWTCDGCTDIANEFKLQGVYNVASTEVYERQNASAVLLIKK